MTLDEVRSVIPLEHRSRVPIDLGSYAYTYTHAGNDYSLEVSDKTVQYTLKLDELDTTYKFNRSFVLIEAIEKHYVPPGQEVGARAAPMRWGIEYGMSSEEVVAMLPPEHRENEFLRAASGLIPPDPNAPDPEAIYWVTVGDRKIGYGFNCDDILINVVYRNFLFPPPL